MTNENAALATDAPCLVDREKIEDLIYATSHFEGLVDALHTVIGSLPDFGEPMSGRKKTALHGLCESFAEISERMNMTLLAIDAETAPNMKPN